jgi:hypothetical protein
MYAPEHFLKWERVMKHLLLRFKTIRFVTAYNAAVGLSNILLHMNGNYDVSGLIPMRYSS